MIPRVDDGFFRGENRRESLSRFGWPSTAYLGRLGGGASSLEIPRKSNDSSFSGSKMGDPYRIKISGRGYQSNHKVNQKLRETLAQYQHVNRSLKPMATSVDKLQLTEEPVSKYKVRTPKWHKSGG